MKNLKLLIEFERSLSPHEFNKYLEDAPFRRLTEEKPRSSETRADAAEPRTVAAESSGTFNRFVMSAALVYGLVGALLLYRRARA